LLRAAGFQLTELAWRDAKAARSASYIINRVETSGVHRSGLLANRDHYGEELALRVTANSLFPVAGYFDALKARTRYRDSMKRYFARNRIDAMVVPAVPATALPADDLVARYSDGSAETVSNAYTRFTMPFNLTGQPTITIPCGFDDQDLPVGLLLAGRPFGESNLLKIGTAIEQAFAGRFGAGWPVAPVTGRVAL
jgi:aspartyl-tRNA(Asn)/glutamyl-tRNA(Gln) amidotransferase subunit A